MTNSTVKMITIALTLVLAIHALPAYSAPQWNSESRDEAAKDGKK